MKKLIPHTENDPITLQHIDPATVIRMRELILGCDLLDKIVVDENRVLVFGLEKLASATSEKVAAICIPGLTPYEKLALFLVHRNLIAGGSHE